ncbi:MAG: SufD family Fe-S cluster assembly protein [Candidatus Magasanikbacteria bacterium]|jgi:Fe-S cluster assembly scaffold protein SufB|nr:SufD family Fe-S cluster assembly protein [Candidatus Magasanikbacteria bacterium]
MSVLSKQQYGPGIVGLEKPVDVSNTSIILKDGEWYDEQMQSDTQSNIDIQVQPGATASYAVSANQISTSATMRTFRLGKGASLQLHMRIDLCDELLSHTSVLLEEGAQVNIKGALSNAGGVVDILDEVQHVGSNSTCQINHRSALKGNAREIYRASMSIPSTAMHCTAHQEARVLLLDKRARIDAIPMLDIACKEVACSHAVTIAKPKEEEIFYLQSRGLSATEAEQAIATHFLSYE